MANSIAWLLPAGEIAGSRYAEKTTMGGAQRFLKIAAIGMLPAAGFVLAQAPAPRLEFEVASIKPAQALQSQVSSGKIHVGMTIDGARVDIGSLSLADLIPIAFRVKPYQVSGPDWMSAERFDVIGKIPDGAAKDQVPEMLQALLADRFKLTIHRENRDQSIYALVVAKGGPKLKESVPEPEAPESADDAQKGIAIGTADRSQVRVTPDGKGGMVTRGGQAGTTRIAPGPDGSMHMEASRVTMAQLADSLSGFVDRPVVDMTDLKGNYQVTLEISMADIMRAARRVGLPVAQPPGGSLGAGAPADAASDPSSSSIFATVQQLGLKLEPRKAPIETIVVDHLEKTPTDN